MEKTQELRTIISWFALHSLMNSKRINTRIQYNITYNTCRSLSLRSLSQHLDQDLAIHF